MADEPETIFSKKKHEQLDRQNLQIFTLNSDQQSQSLGSQMIDFADPGKQSENENDPPQSQQEEQLSSQKSLMEIQFEQNQDVPQFEKSIQLEDALNGGKNSSEKRKSKCKSDSSDTHEESPDLKMERQNKLILKSQRIYMLEVDERNDEAIRAELIEQLKTQFAFKQVHPFDLLITYDDALVEFQVRPHEFVTALRSISIELQEDQKRIVSKYYRVQNKDTISTIKLCCSINEDLGELMLMAINYIINKYRLLIDIFFDQVTQQDKLISVDTLKMLNKEWEWGLEDGKLQQIYNLMTDYGNNLYNIAVFKQKLLKISQVVDSRFTQETYQNLVRQTIINDSIDKFSKKILSLDEQQTGEISIQRFIDIITQHIDRALSKQELNALRIYLQKEQNEEVLIYAKILNDALKVIEEDRQKRQLELDKLHQVQKEIIADYFKYIVDQTQDLQDQYFQGEAKFKMDKDSFLQLTVTLTGFQISMAKAEQIYQMIVEEKIDREDPYINVVEFTQFISRRKQEMLQTEQEKQAVPSLQQISNALDLQSKIPSQSLIQSQLAQSQSKQQQLSVKQMLQIPVNAISQPTSALILKPSQDLKDKQQSSDRVIEKKDKLSSRSQERQLEQRSSKQFEKLVEKSSEKQPDKVSDKQPEKQQEKPTDKSNDKQNDKQPEKPQQQMPLRNDIYSFFNELDVDRVRFLTQQQMFMGLLKIGIMLKGKELLGQKSYDYFAFEKVIMTQIRNFYNSAKIIFNLKKEFDQYKEVENELVKMPLLQLLFEKVRIKIEYDDILYLFELLDKDKKGIKLSDFFYLILQHPSSDYRLNELLFKMKGYYDNSLKAQIILFAKLPFNYIRPFTAKANLPSYSFQLKPNKLGHIEMDPPSKIQGLCKIKILEGEGIPSPEDKQTCFKREVVVAIYDKFYQRFVENSITLKVKYDQSKEDVWIFPSKNRNNGFYLNCENQQHKLHLIVIFELISYFKENNQVHKVSCGFAEIPVTHLLNYGTFVLPLLGGCTEQVISIEKKDIRCTRGGLAGLAAKLGGDIVPHLTISSSRKSKRVSLQKELESLPQLCLCHRNMTQILFAYKKYLLEKHTAGLNTFSQGSETFLFSLDCPYICARMCKLWNRTIQGKMIGQEMGAFQILLGQLQKLIRLQDFNFNPYGPQEVFTPDISKPKRNVVKSIIEYTEYLIDSSYFNRLRLDGDEILKEQMDLYGKPLVQGIFDNVILFDKYYNGLNVMAYDKYVIQMY